MKVAYVDTSCLVAIAFGEPGSDELEMKLAKYDHRVSTGLLEAELRAAFAREEVAMPPGFLRSITWLLPDRPLTAEIGRVLEGGYLRGADLWHVAAALFLDGDHGETAFLTLDAAQRRVAERLGMAGL